MHDLEIIIGKDNTIQFYNNSNASNLHFICNGLNVDKCFMYDGLLVFSAQETIRFIEGEYEFDIVCKGGSLYNGQLSVKSEDKQVE